MVAIFPPLLALSLLERLVVDGLIMLLLLVGICAIAFIILLRGYLKIIVDLFLNRSQIPGSPDTGVQLSGESVVFKTNDGVMLRGIFIPSPNAAGRTIIFCHEYGSDMTSAARFQKFLVPAGFNVFAFDFRGHGQSANLDSYVPKQWLTTHEITDLESAIRYVKGRPDVDPSKIGLLGLSRGACACLAVGSRGNGVRAIVADGAFDTREILVEYIKRWVSVYAILPFLHPWLPDWFYRWVANISIRRAEAMAKCRFVPIEEHMSRLAPPALYMIHGGRDSYVSVEHASRLFRAARAPKEFWVVPNAKHNEGARVAPDEYAQRVTSFFRQYLN